MRRPALALAILVLAFSPESAEAGLGRWTSSGPGSGLLHSPVVDPFDSRTIFVGSEVDGLFRSRDGGLTWQSIGEGLPRMNAAVVAVDPITPGVLYAGAGGSYPSPGNGDLFKSTDEGDNWFHLSSSVFPTTLAVDPAVPTILYASGSGLLLRSEDGGRTWTVRSNQGFSVLAIDPRTTSTLYAGVSSGLLSPAGIFKSVDAGVTWSRLEGFPALYSRFFTYVFHRLVVEPADPRNIYAATNSGLWTSFDAGQTWAQAQTVSPYVVDVEIDPATPVTVYAATGIFLPPFSRGGIFKSTDGARNWLPLTNGLPSPDIRGLAIATHSAKTIYVTTRHRGIFKSADGGETWTGLPGPPVSGISGPAIRALTFDLSGSLLFAGSESDGIFKSSDGGGSWTSVNREIVPGFLRDLRFGGPASSILYAATDRGIYCSRDGGATWGPASIGLTEPDVWSLVVDPSQPTTLYANARTRDGSSTAFKTSDAGDNWVGLIPAGRSG